jgi:hypothetical protein
MKSVIAERVAVSSIIAWLSFIGRGRENRMKVHFDLNPVGRRDRCDVIAKPASELRNGVYEVPVLCRVWVFSNV